jgi:hypothetical protein
VLRSRGCRLMHWAGCSRVREARLSEPAAPGGVGWSRAAFVHVPGKATRVRTCASVQACVCACAHAQTLTPARMHVLTCGSAQTRMLPYLHACVHTGADKLVMYCSAMHTSACMCVALCCRACTSACNHTPTCHVLSQLFIRPCPPHARMRTHARLLPHSTPSRHFAAPTLVHGAPA